MTQKKLTTAALSIALASAFASHAFAESSNDEAKEAAVLGTAKISADEAMRAALDGNPGTVSSLQIHDEAGKPIFLVEIFGADGIQKDISVDAVSGSVLKVASATDRLADQSDGQENGDDKD